MLLGTASDKQAQETRLRRLWGWTKSYVQRVGYVYIDFVGPLLLLVAVNMAVDAQDKERFGLGWLHSTSLKDDRVREEQFPAYEPTSAAQRRRADAANAIEYAATAV